MNYQYTQYQSIILKSIFRMVQLTPNIRFNIKNQFPQQHNSIVTFRKRCIYTHRARGIIRLYNISRIAFKIQSSNALLTGVKHSSW